MGGRKAHPDFFNPCGSMALEIKKPGDVVLDGDGKPVIMQAGWIISDGNTLFVTQEGFDALSAADGFTVQKVN